MHVTHLRWGRAWRPIMLNSACAAADCVWRALRRRHQATVYSHTGTRQQSTARPGPAQPRPAPRLAASRLAALLPCRPHCLPAMPR